MNDGLIISGFQGIGKSTYAGTHINAIDLESSNFDKSNPKWYIDYCKTALDLMEQGYIVFVSSHKIVRDYLLRQTPKYVMVCPTKAMKDVWITDLKDRYLMDRSSKNYRAWKSAEFDFDNNVDEIEKDRYLPTYWIKTTKNRYLSDEMIDEIRELIKIK